MVVLHYLIQQLHWKPKDIEDWLEWESYKKALVIGSIVAKVESDEKHRRELERR